MAASLRHQHLTLLPQTLRQSGITDQLPSIWFAFFSLIWEDVGCSACTITFCTHALCSKQAFFSTQDGLATAAVAASLAQPTDRPNNEGRSVFFPFFWRLLTPNTEQGTRPNSPSRDTAPAYNSRSSRTELCSSRIRPFVTPLLYFLLCVRTPSTRGSSRILPLFVPSSIQRGPVNLPKLPFQRYSQRCSTSLTTAAAHESHPSCFPSLLRVRTPSANGAGRTAPRQPSKH